MCMHKDKDKDKEILFQVLRPIEKTVIKYSIKWYMTYKKYIKIMTKNY